MDETSTKFAGLTMPVFNAFGWAGEDTAIKYALSQLELFIGALSDSLQPDIKDRFRFSGLSTENKSVYLAAAEDVESDLFITFYARPTSFELQLGFTDKKLLKKGLKQVVKEQARWHRLVTELGPEWSLRIQQMERDVESGEMAHYLDLFKDNVTKFDEDTAVEIMSKAEYLNNEDKWVTPIYLSRRYSSDQCAIMGLKILDVMKDQIVHLIPVIAFFTGRIGRKKSSPPKARAKAKPVVESESQEALVSAEDGFNHISVIKPLHIRRGFVNMLPEHWPFFAINSRTETRPVTVYYEGVYDKKSAVWRLVPSDQARLVLSPQVHQWLEENFHPNEQIKLSVRKMDGNEIQISLKKVD